MSGVGGIGNETPTLQRSCRRCRAPMEWTEIPGFGVLWRCEVCSNGVEDVDGTLYRWQRPFVQDEHRDRNEQHAISNKRCPECRRLMREVLMEGFGSRWQCEDCRLTVYSSGGIQRWGPPGPPPSPA